MESTRPGAPAAHSKPAYNCEVCGKSFVPRLKFQTEQTPSGVRAYCSLPCKAAGAAGGAQTCSVCSKQFVPTLAFQVQRTKAGNKAFCSEACVKTAAAPAPAAKRVPHRLAVLNQKGGTGKTTTSISVAAGLAERGKRVLLIDADPQGNVGISLGVRGRVSLYHVLTGEAAVGDAFVPVRKNLDVITGDETLAAAEIKLAQRPGRAAVLREKLGAFDAYDHVIVDCGPSLSLINQNVLVFSEEVLAPVACDYLSLVGVKQVLKTIQNVNRHLGHPLKLGAVLPTMYDARVRICRDAYEALQKHFKELCLTPIRSNTRLKEAPSFKKTIFEHDPSCHGAVDYRRVVEWLDARHPAAAEANARAGGAQ